MTGRSPKSPNQALIELLDGHGMSRKRLAYRVNQLATEAGLRTAYKHTSVARWLGGETPRDPVPTYVAAALSERIGRLVTVEEIGMGASLDRAPAGWDFPRDRSEAIQGVRAHWSGQDGARLADRFAATGYARAVTRWLAVPTDAATAGEGGRRCGREDLEDLRDTAEQARLWDARFGGGDWRLSSVTQCLRDRAVPMVTGSYTEQVGHEFHTRAVGLLLAIAATAACQARDLDQALDYGHRALDILARVSSARAENYLRAVATALTPWAADARVISFTEHLDQRLTHPVAKDVP